MKYFDFMVHSKEKVTRAVCFLPQECPFVMSLNWLDNEGIESKKVRVSDWNDYLWYSFSEVSKVSLNYDEKELLLETQSLTSILNSCSIYERVNIEAVIKIYLQQHLCFLWGKLWCTATKDRLKSHFIIMLLIKLVMVNVIKFNFEII